MLRKNVKLNGFRQVEVYPLALSEKSGTANLYAHGHGASSFTLGATEEGREHFVTVETVTLDSILDRDGIERVDVIKMDVEGAEELILRGAIRVFGRCRPAVIFETNAEAIANLRLSPRGAWDFLAERGYRFYAMQSDGALHPIEQPESANTIALHPSSCVSS
jgi:FkbM family methyltransferase